ncbi:MAG: hypothetical protein MR935_02310 [Agathobaculum sp.]|uniref:transglutaminase domain-containing protein n=1 Tax=Agathobaculum sp. TaxID=2048138 RepID=UPI0025B80734|nr:transglutaminase domain-containing protein [Agathobaculum sp.]MCI7125026.1 hypothetical protein [Agathobaculum sp.]MDY3710903.1 hypothetical protein [Agathobaculum sp.]
MRRPGKLLAMLLIVCATVLMAAYPWLTAVQVQSPFAAAALLERDLRGQNKGVLFRSAQIDLQAVYSALEARYPYAFSLHASSRAGGTTLVRAELSRPARQRQAREYAAVLAAETVSGGMTDAQKLRALHDALVRLCAYDSRTAASAAPDGATAPFAADGALLDHRAVCAGYGRAFGMLCEAVGLRTVYIASEEMNHGWNAVRLDGQTYYIDCTFDDPVPDRGEYVSDRYFLLTAEQLSATHLWDKAFYEQALDSLYAEK